MNDLATGIPCWVTAVWAIPSSWREEGEIGGGKEDTRKWTYVDNNTLNPVVLFEDDGTTNGGAFAVTGNVEAGDLWAKRYFEIPTAIPVVDGIVSVGHDRMRRGCCGATCGRAGNVRIAIGIGGRRLRGFYEDL